MPYSFTLKGHNTRLHDVFESIDPTGREHEILARIVKINTENNGQIYTKIEELNSFNNIENLVAKYNNKLYKTHKDQRLVIENNMIYIYSYEYEAIQIIKKFRRFNYPWYKKLFKLSAIMVDQHFIYNRL